MSQNRQTFILAFSTARRFTRQPESAKKLVKCYNIEIICENQITYTPASRCQSFPRHQKKETVVNKNLNKPELGQLIVELDLVDLAMQIGP